VFDIGIMQGRLMPADLNRSQVFPEQSFEEENVIIKGIGFSHYELLIDKDGVCEKLIKSESGKNKLNLFGSNSGIKTYVACLDCLCSISLLSESEKFCLRLNRIIEDLSKTTVKTLVIPFFDENYINEENVFAGAIKILKKFGCFEKAIKADILLAVEICLSADLIVPIIKEEENLCICLDVGNISDIGFNCVNEIKKIGNKLVHIHFKDKTILGQSVRLGSGLVDFKGVLQTLKKVDYNKRITFETPYFLSPIDEMKKDLSYINNLILSI